MPLTKSDLQKIGIVIDERLGPIEQRLGSIETDLGEVKKDLKSVKTRVKRIEKTVDVMAKLFDKADVRLHKRVTRIETHLGLPQNQN